MSDGVTRLEGESDRLAAALLSNVQPRVASVVERVAALLRFYKIEAPALPVGRSPPGEATMHFRPTNATVTEWSAARAAKNFTRADAIKDQLKSRGINPWGGGERT
jgi:cysteinyl-tRNA synthetase